MPGDDRQAVVLYLQRENGRLRQLLAKMEAAALIVPTSQVVLARKLLGIQFDDMGTPTEKLPCCWRCEEDELCCVDPHVRVRRWLCLRCDWSFEHTNVQEVT